MDRQVFTSFQRFGLWSQRSLKLTTNSPYNTQASTLSSEADSPRWYQVVAGVINTSSVDISSVKVKGLPAAAISFIGLFAIYTWNPVQLVELLVSPYLGKKCVAIRTAQPNTVERLLNNPNISDSAGSWLQSLNFRLEPLLTDPIMIFELDELVRCFFQLPLTSSFAVIDLFLLASLL
jgi:hypothetical protein